MNPDLPSMQAKTVRELIDHLAVADPKAAIEFQGHLAKCAPPTEIRVLSRMVDEVIDALAMEPSYGRRLAAGIGRLMAGGPRVDLDRYLAMVKNAADRGPTLAALFALHLVPVLLCRESRLADRFEEAARIMLQKGTYTLKAPLEALSVLIQENDLASAYAFLDLLESAFALETSYNRSVYLAHTLPRAALGLVPHRRPFQIRGLARVVQTDERLADDYLRGLTTGLHLLSESALDQFLEQAVQRYRDDPEASARYLSLDSRHARALCQDLQVVVPLSAVRSGLERYLHARTGLAVAVRPLSDLPQKDHAGTSTAPLVRSDGRCIYLPDEMDRMQRRGDNVDLCKLLVRLEAGAIEFGTYDLDADKAIHSLPHAPTPDDLETRASTSDLNRLLDRFDNPGLALDLFTVFEHGRIAHHLKRRYPGLFRRLGRALDDHDLMARTGTANGGTLMPLYRHLVIDDRSDGDMGGSILFQSMADRFCREMASGNDEVETSARLAQAFYTQLAGSTGVDGVGDYDPLVLAFGRRFDPALFRPFHTAYHDLAADIRNHLAQHAISVYRSDLRNLLVRQDGQLSAADLKPLIASAWPETGAAPTDDLAWLELEALFCSRGLQRRNDDADAPNVFRYREWDWCMNDYLTDHVRVREHDVHADEPQFYFQTLDTFRGLVRRIRYAFELLRPEEMTILRQWREGDAFDYRALLDYAVDRKAGLIPSDRLFIKRMKRLRDVAVLLLVDLSRSTSNTVDDRGTQVLDVEKQAIVLLCEALNVVGDRFAIAGFSGTGPLGVDYYRIKAIDEPFDDRVKGRISAMAPQRSTRMGAAIRHATAQLDRVPARVRLIIILGDGFPNDLEYKGAYAVEDTRRAVMEARAAAIHVKAITVNVSDNGQLDRLYGQTHHTLIGNVHDLPDKLVRVYSILTRH